MATYGLHRPALSTDTNPLYVGAASKEHQPNVAKVLYFCLGRV
jgi:hypothetical protein